MDFFKALPARPSIRALLQAAGSRIDALEARLLLCAALEVRREYLAAHDDELPTPERLARLDAFFARRAAGEPVAQILGEREFYGRAFSVNPHVLIPRPETELLVELALARLSGHHPRKVLELGTGSGALIVSLAAECAGIEAHAVDLSEAALAVARANAQRHRVEVHFSRSDWFSHISGSCDLIVANPPYIAENDVHLTQGDLRFEPRLALAGGTAGLDAIRTIIRQAPPFLNSGGWLLLEHGYDQAAQVRALLVAAGFNEVTSHRDLAQIERVTLGQYHGIAQFAS